MFHLILTFCKCFKAYAALVRFVPRVSPDVLLKVGELGELALADLATVRLDPEVDLRVLRKVGAVGE